MNIGILGTGSIAHTMAITILQMEDAVLYAVASRTIDKAKSFANEFHMPVYYGSYEEMAKDDQIDLIYIATPHSRHFEDAMLCLENGRNVLCEKAFTVNSRQAEQLINYAEKHQLFLGEAIWTRFMPMRFRLNEIIESGVIGRVSSLTANLGYPISDKERICKPELAGGALLDLGVYCLNFAIMFFGENVLSTKSLCIKNEFGVDIQNSMLLVFDDSRTAILHSNADARTDRRGIIYGHLGRIEVENINNCEEIKVILNDGTIQEYVRPKQITGYEYEVEAAMKAIAAGRTECEEMTHKEILYMMKLMDSFRNEWGIRYPFED